MLYNFCIGGRGSCQINQNARKNPRHSSLIFDGIFRKFLLKNYCIVNPLVKYVHLLLYTDGLYVDIILRCCTVQKSIKL